MSKLKCPVCDSEYINHLTIHNCSPLPEQFLYQCGECQERFGAIEKKQSEQSQSA